MSSLKKISDTWYELDNAAIIFPAVSGEKNTNVFRLCCQLRETIDRDTLQAALEQAMKTYPHFRVIMRRGLFWFYLERTDKRPLVQLESERPCARIFHKSEKELLFRVLYYGRRINLEVFHAISDGGGAMGLLRGIVYHYLALRHKDELPDPLPRLDGVAPPVDMAEDSFRRHYTPEGKDTLFRQRAYTIGGTALPGNNIKIIEACVPTKSILTLAKEHGATVTTYMTALMIESIYKELMPRRAAGKSIAVNVPVDLRGHFPSQSARNFFSVVNISYNYATSPGTFEDVLRSVGEQLREKTDPEKLVGRINYTMGVQTNIATRFTPLLLKNWVLRAAYRKAEQASTCALSNVGRITMPEAFAPYIDRFVCLLNPTNLHRWKLCVCSYESQFVLSFTSVIAETKATAYFVRHLAERGVEVRITCNGGEDDEIL